MSEPLTDHRAAISRHREVFCAAAVVLVLSLVLDVRSDSRVVARGFPGLALPQTCLSKALWNVKCPGCGLTRSMIHLAHGDWSASWHDHRLGAFLAVVIALQIPYRLLALRRPDRPLIPVPVQNLLSYGLIALLASNWLVDVFASTAL
jgi:uncharacterized protein DUF2752